MHLEKQTNINSYMILKVLSENSRNWSQPPFSKFMNLNRHTNTEAQVKLFLLINNISCEWSMNALGVGFYNLSLDLCAPLSHSSQYCQLVRLLCAPALTRTRWGACSAARLKSWNISRQPRLERPVGWSGVLNTKVHSVLIPGQGTDPGCDFDPHLGCIEEAT